ncbi:MAG TPA: oligosaccharide flippase family protein [Blastocatellia bacterium]|nr:oligosaccharide flippase family protein [Blastocatellia bacterium]
MAAPVVANPSYGEQGRPRRAAPTIEEITLAAKTIPPKTGESATPGYRFKLGETTRQAGMLFSAQTVSMFAGFFASIILARWMEPAEMGRFAFCLSIVLVASLFFEFGVSSAGARVLALAQDAREQRQALGALTLMTFVLSIAFTLFIAAVATGIDSIFHKDVRWLFIGTAALAFFQPFQLLIEQSCQGLNQIRRLSVFQLLMSASYLVALIGLIAAGRLTAGTALGAYFAGTGVAAAWTLARMRPTFAGASRFVTLALKETRGYGFNLYLARVSGVASSRSDQIAIGYFLAGTAPLGMYAIAQKFSNPIAMMGRSLAVTRFRTFARLTSVPARITKWNAVALVCAALGLILFGPFVLKFAFPKYSEAAPLLIPFAAMNLFVGLFQPYNVFLASHGRGVELRNIVLIVSAATIVALLVTVPRFGITGAAWTCSASMALDYILHVHYYRNFKQTLANK